MAAVAAMSLLTGGGAFAVASLVPDASQLPTKTVIQEVQALALDAQQDALSAFSFNLYRSEVTRSSDTAESLLRRLNVDDAAAAAFLRSDGLSRQALGGRAGRQITVETDAKNALQKLVARWNAGDDGHFKRLVVEKSARGWGSRIETAPLQASSRMASGTIRSSLLAATDESRIPESVALQIAEIFSGDIDFHRALRKGDRFSVVYETLEGDGEPMRPGRVLSAEFVNAGKTFQAMWFSETSLPAAARAAQVALGQVLPKGGYYTLDGQSLRRAYLASPMEFSRVTSGFKMRFHPILQTWRAHLGVDYGAPKGTPVRTVGDGVVEFAGVQNGFGNVVIVKHQNSHSTVYAHLSKIGVTRGQNVSQGQNLGAVGSTGWATGPHLHFEFRVNGAHKDPLTLALQNETVPITAATKPAFLRAAAAVKVDLGAAASLAAVTAQ